MVTLDELNERGVGRLPGFMGIRVTGAEKNSVSLSLSVESHHMAPNGYLHAGTAVTLADTACGYACITNLPDGAQGFTTIELKSNHLGTARDGTLDCTASPVHAGRTTQVWDAEVLHRESGKTIAVFRCTQLIIYP